jgi:hypothetical protein
MRTAVFAMLCGLAAALLGACVSTPAGTGGNLPRQAALTSNCPEQEGYPDCQDGYHATGVL